MKFTERTKTENCTCKVDERQSSTSYFICINAVS